MGATKVWVRTFHPADYMCIEQRPEERLTLTEQEMLAIAHSLNGGPAYTWMCPEGILACCGVYPLHRGVGIAWCITSPLVRRYPKSFHRYAKRYLTSAIQGMGYKRVHALVDSRFVDSIRWLPRIGLKYETTLKCYGPDGQDFLMFAWCQEVDGDYLCRR